MGFLKCIIYAAFIGIGSFVLGRLLPSRLFNTSKFPFSCAAFEKNGQIYNTLFHVKKWQSKVPDMSKLFPKLMQEKKVTSHFKKDLPCMIRETCIAEWIHWLLCILALPCLLLWPGPGGILFTCLYILGNLPFIIIQRYNRPRLVRLYEKMNHTSERNL